MILVQNPIRSANCKERGSLTAVVWPNTGEGFVGYAPVPQTPFFVRPFTWFSRLKASAIGSIFQRSESLNLWLIRKFTLKKSKPVPVFLLMKTPLTVGRAAVPWIVVVPVVMFKGSYE